MKNKKGFTLIELLAVIIILGVLLLVAVPAITSLIKTAKRNSFISAAKLGLDNVEEVAIIEKEMGSSTAMCYIPINDVKLSRGSWGADSHGYFLVDPTKTTDNGMVKIYYSNKDYSISGIYLKSSAIGVDKDNVTHEDKPTNACTGNESEGQTCIKPCTWYEG